MDEMQSHLGRKTRGTPTQWDGVGEKGRCLVRQRKKMRKRPSARIETTRYQAGRRERWKERAALEQVKQIRLCAARLGDGRKEHTRKVQSGALD
jgi:hypothetical protein